MTSLLQAWRALVRRRAFTLTTILTSRPVFAIATTMFSIVNGILVRPLPYPDGGRMVSVYEFSPGQRERFSLIAPARLDDWNRLNRTFTAISGSYAENVTDTSGAEPERLDGRRVMPRYFEVFGMAPLAGRTFVPDEERFGGSLALVISEPFWARRFARSPAAIGARLIVGGKGFTVAFSQQGGAAFQIVGVVGDVREDRPAAPVVPYVYTCLSAGSWPDPDYVVRVDGDPRVLAGAIRQLAKAIDPARPMFGVKPLADVMDATLDQPRLNAAALGTFAVAALVLAALGLYGLLMLLVAQRRRELGVRMALGASPRDLVRVVVAGAGRLVAIGIAAGLALVLVAGHLLRTLLFGVGPYDPAALAGAVLALTLVAVAAIVVPARQAAAANAMDAMRLE